MPKFASKLSQMTLATTRTLEMVRFYNALFDTQFQAIEAYGTTLYNGTLAGIPLVICPNEIAGYSPAGVKTFLVSDLSLIIHGNWQTAWSPSTP